MATSGEAAAGAGEGRTTARVLLEIDAVNFRTDPPYRLTSGLSSPVYIDCRKIISFPRARARLMDMMVAQVCEAAGYERFDAVAGGETAGIPFAAWVAERLGLPMLYVRKKPKGFGRGAQIEGSLADGARVLLVEDLATDGGSKHVFLKALREAGGEAAHIAVVFFYDAFAGSREALAAEGAALHALATWRDVLAVCRTDAAYQARFSAETLAAVEAFLKDPHAWSAAHGGEG